MAQASRLCALLLSPVRTGFSAVEPFARAYSSCSHDVVHAYTKASKQQQNFSQGPMKHHVSESMYFFSSECSPSSSSKMEMASASERLVASPAAAISSPPKLTRRPSVEDKLLRKLQEDVERSRQAPKTNCGTKLNALGDPLCMVSSSVVAEH